MHNFRVESWNIFDVYLNGDDEERLDKEVDGKPIGKPKNNPQNVCDEKDSADINWKWTNAIISPDQSQLGEVAN